MRHACHGVIAACWLAAAAVGQAIEPAGSETLDLAALKLAYLACDRAASERRLDFGEAADCSIVSEQLLRHGFGGDFNQLLVWWRHAKLADAQPDAPVELARR